MADDLLLQALMGDMQQKAALNPFLMAARPLQQVPEIRYGGGESSMWAAGAQGLANALLGTIGADQVTTEKDKLLQAILGAEAKGGQEGVGMLQQDPDTAKYAAMMQYEQAKAARDSSAALQDKLLDAGLKNGVILGMGPNGGLQSTPIAGWDDPAVKLAAKKEEARQKVKREWSTVTNSTGDPELDRIAQTVPKTLQGKAIAELQNRDKLRNAYDVIGGAYDTTAKVSSMASMVPYSDAAASFDSANAAIMGAIQANWKGPMSDADMRRMSGLLPKSLDTVDRLAIKKNQMMELLRNNTLPTPMLNRLGFDTPQASGLNGQQAPQQQGGQTPVTGGSYNGQKIVSVKRIN